MDERRLAATAVRRFNRIYTRAMGLLGRYLDGDMSLTEMRVLFELATRDGLSATDLCRDLGLDAGYVSRLLARLAARGHVARRPAPEDGRRALIAMTPEGHAAFAPYVAASEADVTRRIAHLDDFGRARLLAAMAEIEALLEARAGEIVIREHRAGDLGAIVAAQSRLYHEEYGWSLDFEAAIAEIAGQFLKHYDPRFSRAFIAEQAGVLVGAALVVRLDPTTAKLRLVHVDKAARGRGLGRRLVADAIAFAAGAGYRRMTLWTNDVLVAARKIYEDAGFVLVGEERHHSFGHDLVGQNFDLDLVHGPGAGRAP